MHIDVRLRFHAHPRVEVRQKRVSQGFVRRLQCVGPARFILPDAAGTGPVAAPVPEVRCLKSAPKETPTPAELDNIWGEVSVVADMLAPFGDDRSLVA
jgi:hypothetical protein